jgi:hypothetical protein
MPRQKKPATIAYHAWGSGRKESLFTCIACGRNFQQLQKHLVQSQYCYDVITKRDADLLSTVVNAGNAPKEQAETCPVTAAEMLASTATRDQSSVRRKRRKKKASTLIRAEGGGSGGNQLEPTPLPMDCASAYGSEDDDDDKPQALRMATPETAPLDDVDMEDDVAWEADDEHEEVHELDEDAQQEQQSKVDMIQEFLIHTSQLDKEEDESDSFGSPTGQNDSNPSSAKDQRLDGVAGSLPWNDLSGNESEAWQAVASESEGESAQPASPTYDEKTAATNMADDGKSTSLWQGGLSTLAPPTLKDTGYTEEQLNDPEWCVANLVPGIEINYPVEEVMLRLPQLTSQEVVLVELYNIVANNCVNLRTFDAIVTLISRELSTGGLNKDVKLPTRKTFVANMKKKFPCDPPDVQRVDPSIVDHGIPTAGGNIPPVPSVKHDVVSVFFWNAKKAIIESLCCPRLYGDTDNLIVNDNDPFSKYIPHSSPNEDGCEILSGRVYQDTYNQVIQNPETEYLAAYYMYLDKASSGDAQQRYNAEPVAIVCAYLKRLSRNMVKNWIMLGFIPDLELGSSAKKTKYRNTNSGKVSLCHFPR